MKTIVAITVIMAAMTAACGDGNEKANTANDSIPKAIDSINMDLSLSPGTDFYQYANGGWLKSHPIPEEYGIYGSFHVLAEQNNLMLKSLFEEAMNINDPGKADWKKIGDFYASGMDTVKIAADGLKPLNKWMEAIENAKSTEDIQKLIADLHQAQIYPCFYIYSGQDEKNSNMVIAQIMQGGLGLPDRDYYLDDDDQSKLLRSEYYNYIVKLFGLMGKTEKEANSAADFILKLETEFAKASMTRLAMRDPNLLYNKMTVEDLQKISPDFNWKNYFAAIGLPSLKELNVNQPEFVKVLSKLMKSTDVAIWKDYLRFRLVNSSSPYLSPDFEQANFAFYGTVLSGKTKMRDRWKRVVDVTSDCMGEAVGKVYVEKYFPAEAKTRMLELVKNLKASLDEHIRALPWMTEETKEKALQKLEKMTLKIGYPDKWIDYSSLTVSRESYVGNVFAASEFDFKKMISEIDKPVDRLKWEMNPQTVNAYYSPTMNEIVFPAAILQPPFFYMNADDAVNYGAIGAVIGHEMTHGFDDQGRLYDLNGNLADWWTTEDSEKFSKQTEPMVVAYDNFFMTDTLHVNGKLTLGENIADFGGVALSLDALKKVLKNQDEKIEGFTPMQRFFLSYAQVWRSNIREQELMRRIKEDVHSPARARVNGLVYHIDAFYEAFGITDKDPKFIAVNERIRIW